MMGSTVPASTRCFVLESLGYDGLVQSTRPVGRPASGEVLIRMGAASLNYRDLKILRGTYARPPQLPIILLSDGAAEVVDIGPGVSQFNVGDRVMPIYMEGWYSGPWNGRIEAGWRAKGGDVDGVAIELAVCRDADLLPIPDFFSLPEAACFPCAGATAWHSLVPAGRFASGETVLIMGSGGVSVFALQIATAMGARVIVTSSSETKLSRMIGMGASAGVNYVLCPDWAEEVRRLTDGVGVDHVIDVGGEQTLPQSVRATRDGGHVACVGNLAGRYAAHVPTERGIRVSQIAIGSRQMTEDLVRAFETHRLRPVIDRTFPFAQLKEALAYLESGSHFGKVVLNF